MDAESPAVSHFLGSVGEHDITGRIAGGAAEALQNDEDSRQLPAPGRREQRDGRHLYHISEDRDRPELSGFVAENSGHEPPGIPHKFTKTGDKGNGKSAGTK